jgi:hypothetical protein
VVSLSNHWKLFVGEALRTATYNYQHGAGFDVLIMDWLG